MLTNYSTSEMGITMEDSSKNVTSGWSKYNGNNIAANYFTSDDPALFAERFGDEVVVGMDYVERYQNGSERKRTANNLTRITNSTTSLDNGWYCVDGEVTVDTRLYVDTQKDVRIILKDGAVLNMPKGIEVKPATTADGNEGILRIYGQDKDSGKLIATGEDYQAGIGGNDKSGNGRIYIHGGIIEAEGGDYGAGIGGGNENSGG